MSTATRITHKAVVEAAIERTTVALDTDGSALVDEFVEVRDLITALEKKKKDLDARIRVILGDADAATVDGRVRLEVSRRHREGVDRTALAEAFPEAYAATRTVTDYSVLVTK
jgi:DNA-binding transcriptional regulator/RsmH inhibitor MraZ